MALSSALIEVRQQIWHHLVGKGTQIKATTLRAPSRQRRLRFTLRIIMILRLTSGKQTTKFPALSTLLKRKQKMFGFRLWAKKYFY